MENNVPQTEFLNQAPWQDQVVVTPVEVPLEPLPDDAAQPPEKKKPWKLILIASLSGLLVLLIILAVIFRPQGMPVFQNDSSQPTQINATLTILEQKAASLSAELKKADPVKTEFPFPPVNMDLALPTPSPQL